MDSRETARHSSPQQDVEKAGVEEVRTALAKGPLPRGDGWGGIYAVFDRCAKPGSLPRRAVCRHFWPGKTERAGDGQIYRRLGVARFGRIIPTGGVSVRRLTRARMAPYTLRGTSLTAARDFYYRTCAFEAAHLPFMLALLAITGFQLAAGRFDLASQDMLVNLAVNIYPIMHHRHTRVRIVRLLMRAARRAPGRGPSSR